MVVDLDATGLRKEGSPALSYSIRVKGGNVLDRYSSMTILKSLSQSMLMMTVYLEWQSKTEVTDLMVCCMLRFLRIRQGAERLDCSRCTIAKQDRG